jgi:hypothetical protein
MEVAVVHYMGIATPMEVAAAIGVRLEELRGHTDGGRSDVNMRNSYTDGGRSRLWANT